VAAETALRIGTVAVLALLLGSVVAVVLRLRRAPQAEVRLSLWQHVEELRRRVLVVAGVLLGGMAIALVVRIGTWHGIPVPLPALYDPVTSQLFRIAAAHLVPPGVTLVVTGPMDGFRAQLAIAFGLGVLLAVPVAVHQLGRFLGPAMRRRERRLLAWALVPGLALFLLGAAFGYAIVLPVTLDALYRFSGALGAAAFLQVGDFASFTLSFLVGFGVAFQMPLVMVALNRAGLVPASAYWRRWRHATVAILVAATVLTPDPTVVSQVLLTGPMVALYLVGAGVSSRLERRQAAGAGA
jgi:sec-independent protein translocase protein TatC